MDPNVLKYIAYAISLIVTYKILDYVIRIPKIDSPTGKKKNILITGCDTGFGNVFAKRMTSKGFTVFAGCLTEDGRRELCDLKRDTLKPFILDVTDKKSIERGYIYVKSQLAEGEGLWAIVNNAGIMGTSAPFEWLEREDFLKTIDINAFGVFMITKAFIPLVKVTRGRVVNTCSVIGRFALPYAGPYIVSKYAAEGLSDTLRRELYLFGISLHMIEPGFFWTRLTAPDLVKGTLYKRWGELDQGMRDEYGERFLEGTAKMVSDILPSIGSKNLDLVVDCYEHAITATFPRGRYMPGLDSKYFYYALSLLPEWLSDGLLAMGSRLIVPPPAGATRR